MQQMWSDIDAYIESHLIPNDPVLNQTLENTAAKGFPDHLAVAANQGMLLQMLIQMNKCKRVLELGTFAAYSTMWLARAAAAKLPQSAISCSMVSAPGVRTSRGVGIRSIQHLGRIHHARKGGSSTSCHLASHSPLATGIQTPGPGAPGG